MTGLRRYQREPRHLIGTAYQLFKSRRIRTVVVEGITDKRFLEQWTKPTGLIRFDGLDGKRVVTGVYQLAQTKPYIDDKFLMYFADVDWDVIHSKPLINCQEFVYNAFCRSTGRLIYNDLECFLVNTLALEKIMSNLDMDKGKANELRVKIELATRQIGAYRAADEIVRKKAGKTNSILNGLDAVSYFDADSFKIDVARLEKDLPRWANYKEEVGDLIDCAKHLLTTHTLGWSLSRGHDVTELLCEHFEAKGIKGLRPDRLEMMLRLACELNTFKESPMGQNLQLADTGKAFFD